MKRRMAAILAADIAGFSRLVAEDEEETLRRLPSYRQVFDDFVTTYGGRVFNTAGDLVMCAFDSAVDAVRAAIDIQELLRTRNLAYPPSRRMMYRIGVTVGDVVERDGDLLGDAVNIASRLELLAAPGGICVARSVHEAVANKIAVPFRDIGPRELKNIPQPVHAYVVAWPGQETVADAVPPQSRGDRDREDRDRETRDRQREARDWEREAHDERRRDRDEGRRARRQGREEGRRARRGPGWRALAVPLVLLAIIFVAVPAFRAIKRSIDAWLPETPTKVSTKTPDKTIPGEPPLNLGADAATAYAALATTGRLVDKPRTAAELYHNARLTEAKGETRRTRRAYKDYVKLREDFVDPHLKLMGLVRRDEGRAGSREFYDELAKEEPARVVGLMQALTYDGAERRSKLEALAASNPEFVPVHYFLAEELSARGTGTATLGERRAELAALERIIAADADGSLAKFFLDRSVEREWVDKAKLRKAALAETLASTPTQPSASFSRGAEGWKVTLTLPEPATAITYRIGVAGEIKPTGTGAGTDPRTGKAEALTTFSLPATQEAATLQVAYKDARDREAGPFDIAFDPAAALTEQLAALLDTTPDLWVAFVRDRVDLLTVNHLIENRCAITKVAVGFDGGPLELTVRLPACDMAKPFAIPPDADTAVVIPKNAKEVAVQLSYADGKLSETRTFRRP